MELIDALEEIGAQEKATTNTNVKEGTHIEFKSVTIKTP